MCKFNNLVVALLLASVCGARAEMRSVVSWDLSGADGGGWTAQAHHCKDVRVENGVLKGSTSGRDPFVTSPTFTLDANAHQIVVFRAKWPVAGMGELFWIPVGEKGANQKRSVSFDWHGNSDWQEYHVRPYWQGEKQIGQFRLDFPNGAVGHEFELAEIRICEDGGAVVAGESAEWGGAALESWQPLECAKVSYSAEGARVVTGEDSRGGLISPRLSIDANSAYLVAVEMAVKKGEKWSLFWARAKKNELSRMTFNVVCDGKMRTYNLDVSGETGWDGKVSRMELRPSGSAGEAVIKRVVVGDEPQGAAELQVQYARLEDALNPAGKPASFVVGLGNSGGKQINDVRLAVVEAPAGVRVVSASGWERCANLMVFDNNVERFNLLAERAVKGRIVIEVSGEGVESQRISQEIEFLADKGLSKADYVPVPQPIKSSVEIGALYYPGWQQIERWARIWPVAPERKPVLGWYDETNPEVVDWQIKWAVENGISFKLVDWYWNKGHQHNDHWVKAFQKARYKSYLKWAVMWANHNAPGSHSEDDQRAVTKFWLENYFNTPEYYRIDDKPVVMIWSARNMNADLKSSDGCKRLLDISRQMAVEAGYKGVYFIAMKWPEAATDAATVQSYKDMGFDMTSIYHYMHHGGKAENPRRFHFDLVAESNYDYWQGLQQTGILPFLPNLSTGWDDRPWHGDKGTEIYGRTVEHFRRICRDARRFVAESGVKRVVLAPLNEWGEGSYAEPCAEFGFGMYEALREELCQKPAGGWPLNYGPKDVGLGPYDLPMPVSVTEWEFEKSDGGWKAMMGIKEYHGGEGSLRFVTTTHDPAIQRGIKPIIANNFKQLVVEMKVSANASGGCQLFWSSGGTPSEHTSLRLPLKADGEFHSYVFDLAAKNSWRGKVSTLRFDPCSNAGVEVEIRSIRLVSAAE